MRHLIIGAGNMGKRHGGILTHFGDDVKYVDMEYSPGLAADECGRYQSVLICTPAETHYAYIKALALVKNPPDLFVEKPVCVDGEVLDYPGKSMVACNWVFCECLREPLESIECWYRNDSEHRYLDMVHFAHLEMHKRLTITIHFMQHISGITVVNGKLFSHNPGCNMFASQMAYWRQIITEKSDTILTISKASRKAGELRSIYTGDKMANTISMDICDGYTSFYGRLY